MLAKKRSRRNDGSITKRKDGRWMARYTVVLPDGTKKRQVLYAKTSEEVRKKMRSEMASSADGLPVIRNGQKVGEYLDYWLESTTSINEGTRYKYRGTVRKHIKPAIGKIPLSSLNTVHIQQMINNHIKNKGSVRVAQVIRNTLSSSLRVAKKQSLIAHNFARDVEIPRYNPKEKEIWNREQALRFMEYAKANKYYPIFELILSYGLRRGEALGLDWKDINLENRVFRITQQITSIGEGVGICPPKTKNSVRELPITSHIGDILDGLSHDSISGLVFKTAKGDMIKPSSLVWEYKKVIRNAGLPYLPIHNLRHFVATNLKSSGVQPKDAQTILGHSSMLTTMQYYQHSTIDSKADALDKYAKSMAF